MITPAKLIRKIQARQGFTLAEVLIATTVFTVATVIGVTVFVNVLRIQRKVILENAIYEDGRFMIERIAREIRQNTIDYEEYYRASAELKHGQAFGCYAERFYNPGTNGIGAVCSIPAGGDPAANPGCIIDKNTLDINTGQNPYEGTGFADMRGANAFCDEKYHTDNPPDCDPTMTNSLHKQKELYLINPAGTQKTYLSRKKVDTIEDEYAVALLRLIGKDIDTDGITEAWVDDSDPDPLVMDYFEFCAPGYGCLGVDDLTANLSGADLLDKYVGFVPITPLRTNVIDLNFYVSPLEDPKKAYAETVPADGIQQQPHVTVVLSLQPASSEMDVYASDPPVITLQTTVTSRAYNGVESYLGRAVCP